MSLIGETAAAQAADLIKDGSDASFVADVIEASKTVPVIVDFWATWCGPCIAELENLKRIYSQYHQRGLEIVGVNLDDSREGLQDFLSQHELPWPVLHDAPQSPASHGHPLARYYGITALPTLILVDREGRVVSTKARGEELEKLLTELIGPVE